MFKDQRKVLFLGADQPVGPWPEPPVADIDSDDYFHPPWQKFPNIPCGSMGWRMGPGERFYARFCNWWVQQPSPVRFAIRARYPEPESWEGFWRNLFTAGE